MQRSWRFGGSTFVVLTVMALCVPMVCRTQEATMPMPAAAPAKSDELTITAGPGQRGVFTLATLKDFPHQTVTIFDHHTNANETYSGVPLMDLLAKLGVPHGEALRGKAMTDYIVATGADGYKSLVALAEIDPEFHPGMVLVADAMDGKPLGATGPFRLVVSEDKRPARSVRNLVSIEVKTAEQVSPVGWSAAKTAHLPKLVEISIGRRKAEDTAHGHDLTFVMEGVGEDVVKDQSRCAVCDFAIGKAQFGIDVKVVVRQACEVVEGS
jgi:hypothetical protein